MTKTETETIHQAVRIVAGACDGAVKRDDNGFNGTDSAFGKSLAQQSYLSPRQAASALKMVLKYKRQIGDELHARLVAIDPDAAPAPAPEAPAAAIDIETLAVWTQAKRVSTRAGDRMLRKATPTPEFWASWRASKEAIKALGVSVSKNAAGDFEVCHWGAVPAEEIQAALAQRQEAARAVIQAEDRLSDELSGKMLWYQPPGVLRLIRSLGSNGTALDASDTGTGKTYIALAAAKALGLEAVVICPKAVIPSWKKAARHIGVAVTAINYEGVKTGKTALGKWEEIEVVRGRKREVATVEQFVWKLDHRHVLIFDEVHRCKAQKSQNAEMLLAAKRCNIRTGLKVLGLSATAASDTLHMKALGYLLGLYQSEGGFWGWAVRHGVKKGRYGMEFVGGAEGTEAIRRIHHDIFDGGKGQRIRISDVPDFPETVISSDILDFNGASAEIQRAYDEMEAALDNLAEMSAKDRQGMVLTEILRARQKSELLKVPSLADMARDAVAEGNSVAIFVNFDETINHLMRLLETDCVVRGDQTDAERAYNIDRFQAGQEFPRLSLICPTYSAQDMKQALGRTHRAKSDEQAPNVPVARILIANIRAGGVGISLHRFDGATSVQKIVFAEGTIEEEAALAVEGKLHNIELLNDGDVLQGLRLTRRA